MEFAISDIVSLTPRQGQEDSVQENELLTAIEYKTKQGIAISFYVVKLAGMQSQLLKGKERPSTLKFLEREAHSWWAVVNYTSAEPKEFELPEAELMQFFEAQNITLPGK